MKQAFKWATKPSLKKHEVIIGRTWALNFLIRLDLFMQSLA